MQKGELRLLAYFIKLKSKYSNSHIYNFNYASAAVCFGCSRYAMKKYVRIMIEKGWCDFHGKHLRVSRLEEIYQTENIEKSISLEVKETITITEIILYIKKTVLDNNLKQQKYMEESYGDLNTGESHWLPIISAKGLGDLLHTSKSAAQRVKKAFTSRNWFIFLKRTQLVARNIQLSDFYGWKNAYSHVSAYWYNNCIFQTLPCAVIQVQKKHHCTASRAHAL